MSENGYGLIFGISDKAEDNKDYSRPIYHNSSVQVVLQNLGPHEQLEKEIHKNIAQVISVVSGSGYAIIDGDKVYFDKGDLLIIEPGHEHQIFAEEYGLIFYSIYTSKVHSGNVKKYSDIKNELKYTFENEKGQSFSIIESDFMCANSGNNYTLVSKENPDLKCTHFHETFDIFCDNIDIGLEWPCKSCFLENK